MHVWMQHNLHVIGDDVVFSALAGIACKSRQRSLGWALRLRYGRQQFGGVDAITWTCGTCPYVYINGIA